MRLPIKLGPALTDKKSNEIIDVRKQIRFCHSFLFSYELLC